MRITRRLLAVSMIMMLPACIAPDASPKPTAVDRANLATILVYRTKTDHDSMSLEAPHIYVGDRRIGSIRVATQLGAEVPAGTYRVTVRKSVMFMPAYELGAVELAVEAGKTYYLRYDLRYGAAVISPTGGAYMPGTSSFALVDEATARREM